MKATQENVFCDSTYYVNPSSYHHQSEQRHEQTYFPIVNTKNTVLADSNSKSSHIYNFQKYDKAFMVAIDVILSQK
jgi:hypothetical protein